VTADLQLRPPWNGTGLVYLIRHAEKTWALGCLSDKGEARAQNLLRVFGGEPSRSHDAFLAPTSIFANWYQDPTACEVCSRTVTPLALHLGLPVNTMHGGEHFAWGSGGGNAGAAEAMKKSLQAMGGPVLAVWDHRNIKYLAEALGVGKRRIPDWKDSNYDSVYVLKFNRDGALVSFSEAHQNFRDFHLNRLARAG